MQVYTMGFTRKNAKEFFDLISANHIEMLIDVRLNNQSQLSGFTKGKDLAFFLKEICQCAYEHELLFAPTKKILDDYKKKLIDWEEYEHEYNDLIAKRKISDIFLKKYNNYERILLLCSEPTSQNCHRRLLAEYLKKELGCTIRHI